MNAILFSLIQHFLKLPLRDALSDSFKAIHGILRALRKHSGDEKITAAMRNYFCEGCPFYDAKWKTCGTPGETMGEPLGVQLKVGCWCYLPIANRDPKKDCYARANDLHDPHGNQVGWPDVLRPFQEKP